MEDWKLLLGKGVLLLAFLVGWILGIVTDSQMIAVIGFVMALDHISTGASLYRMKKKLEEGKGE